MKPDLRGLVEATTWLDTHEHLPEESHRLEAPVAGSRLHPCEGWAYLLWHYALDDLVSSGLGPEQRAVFVSRDAGPEEKWDAAETAYRRSANTAYVRAARESIHAVVGLDLSRENVAEIDRRLTALRTPGFYRRVLDVAGVGACQVNSLQRTFQETADPERLHQDIGLTDFILPTEPAVAEWEAVTGIRIDCLADLLEVVDRYFDRFAGDAVAVKLAIAYARPIAPAADGRTSQRDRSFPMWLRGEATDTTAARAIEDAVLERGLRRAADHRLTVKVHTGLHVGNDRMDLRSVRDNVADVCSLARRFATDFTLMHIGYPYTDEVIAAAKHHTNVVADMCWAWIIDPIGSRTFLKRFLVSAPASKVLCFGGDYIPVENIVGHAALARRELARTLEELVAEGYLDGMEAMDLVPRLMAGNGERLFYERRRNR
jgi:uncharacterized protein